MKEIIVDFENEVVIFNLESQQGEEFNNNLNQLKTINLLKDIEDSVYLSLCKSSIIGFDFENNVIKTYKPIIYDKSLGTLYPSGKLQEKNIHKYQELNILFKQIYESLGYEEVNLTEEVSNIINGIFF